MKVLAPLLLVAFGLFNVAGGVAGYVRKSSTASLVAGGLAGLALVACACFLGQGSEVAGWGAVVVIVALLGRFLPAFLRSGTWWPAGYLVLLAVPTLLAVLAHLWRT